MRIIMILSLFLSIVFSQNILRDVDCTKNLKRANAIAYDRIYKILYIANTDGMIRKCSVKKKKNIITLTSLGNIYLPNLKIDSLAIDRNNQLSVMTNSKRVISVLDTKNIDLYTIENIKKQEFQSMAYSRYYGYIYNIENEHNEFFTIKNDKKKYHIDNYFNNGHIYGLSTVKNYTNILILLSMGDNRNNRRLVNIRTINMYNGYSELKYTDISEVDYRGITDYDSTRQTISVFLVNYSEYSRNTKIKLLEIGDK